MNRRVFLASVGGACVPTIAGCATVLDAFDGEPCEGDDCDVGMTRNEFVPERYETRVGESVVWKNTSEADHTVTAYELALPEGATYFASGGYETEEAAREHWHDSRGGRIGTRETYEHTFDVPGVYSYVCIPHEYGEMIGYIDVTA